MSQKESGRAIHLNNPRSRPLDKTTQEFKANLEHLEQEGPSRAGTSPTRHVSPACPQLTRLTLGGTTQRLFTCTMPRRLAQARARTPHTPPDKPRKTTLDRLLPQTTTPGAGRESCRGSCAAVCGQAVRQGRTRQGSRGQVIIAGMVDLGSQVVKKGATIAVNMELDTFCNEMCEEDGRPTKHTSWRAHLHPIEMFD